MSPQSLEMFALKSTIGFLVFAAASVSSLMAQHQQGNTSAVHTTPADLAIKRFQLAPGLRAELFAAEPLLANPVAIHLDEQGRCFVAETHRLHKGVPDIRGRRGWPSQEVLRQLPASTIENLDEILLVEDLALRTVEDRIRFFQKWKGSEVSTMSQASEALRLVLDSNGDGRADRSTVFATNFNTIADGLASGVLSRGNQVWFANIPHLWQLEDSNADGVADRQKSLHQGYGVRTGFLGHDLHGLIFGPDGRLYFSIGDRGADIKLPNGKRLSHPDTGAVFRCDPNGSNLELFHTGLRNPQELAFDEFGNLFTGENNSDGGDQARIVHLVQGGDSGWRIGWQFIEKPNSRGPWNSERMWHPHHANQPSHIVPPITNITSGPSGFAYNPGTALGPQEAGKFYLVDFRGSSANSGVHSFRLKPRGASFELVDHGQPVWSLLATDVCFGPDGGLYVSDWIEGWAMTGKGRIYRVLDPLYATNAIVLETRKLLAGGMSKHDLNRLGSLLSHPDARVRQAAQFEWVERLTPAKGKPRPPSSALASLESIASQSPERFARLHGLWALGQLSRRGLSTQGTIRALLNDTDARVRTQAAAVLGDLASSLGKLDQRSSVSTRLVQLLQDPDAAVRMHSALALAQIRGKSAGPALISLLDSNNDTDPYIRHAAVMGLVGLNDRTALVAAAKHTSTAVRKGVLLAMRRLQMPEVSTFLQDSHAQLVLEAARAIHDEPMVELEPQLASLIHRRLDSAPLVRRVLAANFRQGGSAHAEALAAFAASMNYPDSWRTEAIELLAQWATPPQRDPVTGSWRPLAPRPLKTAAEAFSPKAEDLIRNGSMTVRMSAMETVGKLGLVKAKSLLEQTLADSNQYPEIRSSALRAFAALKTPDGSITLANAMRDSNEKVRLEATRLLARTGAEALPHLNAALDTGSLPEKQAALSAIGMISGPDAEKTIADGLRRMLDNKLDQGIAVELLEAADSKKSSPAISGLLERVKASTGSNDELGEYRIALSGGNRLAGKKVFMESETASCIRCHKLGGVGGEAAPALDGIGSKFNREYLLESIVLPNKVIAAGFENIIVSLKNGSSYAGVLKKETPGEIEIQSPEDGLVTVKKSDLTGREKGASGMLPDIAKLLTKRELRDLIEFLASLN